MSEHVVEVSGVREHGFARRLENCGTVHVSMFTYKQAIFHQPRARLADNHLEVGEPLGVSGVRRNQCRERFVPEHGIQRRELFGTHVRRIGDDQVDATHQGPVQSVEPGGVDRRHAVQSVLRGVRARDVERVARRVDCDERGVDVELAQLVEQRETYRPRPASEVDDQRLGQPSLHELIEGEPDELFGLGARDEYPRIEVEVEGSKGPVTEDVLDRFAVQSALGRRSHRGDRFVIGRRELLDQPSGLSTIESGVDEFSHQVRISVHRSRPVVARASRPTGRRRSYRGNRPARCRAYRW